MEAGVAIVGIDDVQARELGREFGQDAIFEWSPTALAILSCTESRARYTGWTATPVETATETSPPPDTPVHDVTPNAPSLGQASPTDTEPTMEPATSPGGSGQSRAPQTAAERRDHIRAYFRGLSHRTGLLFSIISEDRDEPTINLVGTGSSIEIQQPDTPARVIANIPDGLSDAVLALSDDGSLLELISAAWNAGDIAFALGPAFPDLVIDSVEWSVWDVWPDVESPVLLPRQFETPPSCLIASCQWEFVDGGSSPVSDSSGTNELLQVGPLFISRGDEWAHVSDAKTRKQAIREFERDCAPQEGLEQSIFIEPGQLD